MQHAVRTRVLRIGWRTAPLLLPATKVALAAVAALFLLLLLSFLFGAATQCADMWAFSPVVTCDVVFI